MEITFKNESTEGGIEVAGRRYLESTIDSLNEFMEGAEGLNEYGLSIDRHEEEEYTSYCMSWGGPSEEVRFHDDGLIEYVYLDWFCGIGFNVTDTELFQWLSDELYIEGYK